MKSINNDIKKANTLPGKFYQTNESFNNCKELIFCKTWQLISEESKIPLSNNAWPFLFMDGFIEEPLVLVKNNENKINCFSNVCTHRGNILIENPCSINKDITCKYHGRRFNTCGKFVSMPETQGMENFPTEDDNLTNVPLKKWKQFLFTSLDPKIELDDLIKEMNDRIGWMPIEDYIFDPNASRDYLVKANWALYCDNYLEGFHIPFIHKELAKTLDYSKYQTEIYQYSNLQLGIASGGEYCFELPKSSPDYGKEIAAYYFWVFPNMMFNFYPWGFH